MIAPIPEPSSSGKPISLGTAAPESNSGSAESLPSELPLRDDLVIHEQRAGSSHQILEDLANNKFYRLGPTEAAFVRRLIARESVDQAWQGAQDDEAASDRQDFSKASALSLCKWLAANGLTVQEGGNASAAMQPPQRPKGILPLLGTCFFWKRSLLNPDAGVTWLVARVGWLFTWQVLAIGQLLLVCGLLAISGNWQNFLASYENLLSPWRGVWLAVAWFVLKIIHELAHAGTCRRYGGEVRDAGIAMILLMPIAYVDVTSSWRFPSRWHRLHVTLAGVGAELLVAGLAMFAWVYFDSLPIKQAAADLVLLASVSSLLFNLNPLLKFDGYFALADATGIDNLYSYGQSYAKYWGARYVCGLHTPIPSLPAGHGWIKVYGLAAAVYRTITVTGLIIAAAAIFHGAGIVIAFAGITSFIVVPMAKLAIYLTQLYRSSDLHLGRLAIRLGGFASAIILLLFVTPADLQMTMPAIVQYDPPAVVRSPVDGFVASVHVDDGQLLTAGQPIVTIRSDDLQQQIALLRKDILMVEQEIRSARWQSDSSALGDAQAREHGLRDQLCEKQSQVENLIVRAASDGRMVSRELQTLVGRFVRQGDEIGVVGFEQRKRLKVSIDQRDLRNMLGSATSDDARSEKVSIVQRDLRNMLGSATSEDSKRELVSLGDREGNRFADWAASSVRVVVSGKPSWEAQISHIESRCASESIPDEALIASNGGSLPVVQVSADSATLCAPRVNAYIKLSATMSRQLHCGRRAFVQIGADRDSLGMLLWRYLANQLR